jgi:signal transduction histidine kinase
VWSLHPDADEYRNLAESLQRSLTQLTQHTPLQADLAIVGTPQSVPPDIGMNLLRIAQEATTNTLRHAQAQTLQLELTFRVDGIELRSQDDGQGFSPQLVHDRGGFGLLGMQQRCDRLNGQLTLQSQPGQGSCILIQIPLTPSLS